jgi:hypothetical protein
LSSDILENNPKWWRYSRWRGSRFFCFPAINELSNPARFWKGQYLWNLVEKIQDGGILFSPVSAKEFYSKWWHTIISDRVIEVQNGGDIEDGVHVFLRFLLYLQLLLTDFDKQSHFGKLRKNTMEIHLLESVISQDDGRIQDGCHFSFCTQLSFDFNDL